MKKNFIKAFKTALLFAIIFFSGAIFSNAQTLTLTLPANNATGIKPDTVTFKWEVVSTATSYSLELGNAPTLPAASTQTIDGITGIGINITGFPESAKYYWRVKAFEGTNVIATSEIWNFTTSGGTTSDVIELTIPTNNATGINPDSVFFSWKAVSGATTYNLELGTDANLAGCQVVDNLLSAAALMNGFPESAKYYWRVKAFEGTNVIATSEIWNFTTSGGTTSDVIELIAPANSIVGISPEVIEFKWKAVVGTASYILEIGTDAALIGCQVVDNIPTAGISMNGFPESAKYYWRVKAFNGTNVIATSEIWNFVTGTVGIDAFDFINQLTISPNPVNEQAVLSFVLPQDSDLTITICDMTGAEISTISSFYSKGNNQTLLNFKSLNNGAYICRLNINEKQVGIVQFIISK